MPAAHTAQSRPGHLTRFAGRLDRLGTRVEPVLSALMCAGGQRFRGIHHGVSWVADPCIVSSASPVRAGLLADKTFRDGVAVVGRLGLSYDVSLYHPQVNDVADLATAFPDT